MSRSRVKLDEYGISKKRYKELCGFCEQYPDWKRQIADYSYIKPAFKTSEVCGGGGTSDPTFDAALKLDRYIENVELIERVAQEVDKDMWMFLIKAICYEVPPTYLINMEGMPMSLRTYFNRRRYFFYLLDKNR